MNEMRHIAIILPLLASISTVSGQVFYKKSAIIKHSTNKEQRGWLFYLFVGNALFAGSIICNFFAMKFMPLFVVYAFTALNYVFVTLSSGTILKEKIKINNMISSILIAFGVFLITVF